jgi:hypothetical protein
MFIPDPNFSIPDPIFFNPGYRIPERHKNLSNFYPKNCFLDPGNMIRVVIPDPDPQHLSVDVDNCIPSKVIVAKAEQ